MTPRDELERIAEEIEAESQRGNIRVVNAWVARLCALAARLPAWTEECVYAAVREAVHAYRCQHTTNADDEGEHLGLVDVLTPPNTESITLGVDECNLLVDAIGSAVVDALELPAARGGPPDEG